MAAGAATVGGARWAYAALAQYREGIPPIRFGNLRGPPFVEMLRAPSHPERVCRKSKARSV
jgi:hypothetical protein